MRPPEMLGPHGLRVPWMRRQSSGPTANTSHAAEEGASQYWREVELDAKTAYPADFAVDGALL